MMRTIFFPLILGVGGVAVLLWLGFWQLDRLAWKQAVLADIDARLMAAPVPVAAGMTEAGDEYRAVVLSGVPTGEELHVLVSGTAAGTGYRVISGFETDSGLRVMVDQGLLPLEAKGAAPLVAPMQVEGTLLWPDDRNSSTPDPDVAGNIWFARDVGPMAEVLGTAPLMVVARQVTPPDPRLTVLPVDVATIKNDHWEYAVTWFLLAAVWGAMTLYFIYRATRREGA